MQFHFRMVDPLVGDFLREYLISSGATFYDFYRFLCSDLHLQSEHLMSFYTVSEDWEKQMELTLLDMGDSGTELPTVAMNTVRLGDVLTQVGDRLIFCHDIFLNRNLYVQLIAIEEGDVALLPGKCLKAVGADPAPSPDMEESVLDDLRDLYQ